MPGIGDPSEQLPVDKNGCGEHHVHLVARGDPRIVAAPDIALGNSGFAAMRFEDVANAERRACVEELHIGRVDHDFGVLGQDRHVEVERGEERRPRDARYRIAMREVDGPQLLTEHLESDRIQFVVERLVEPQSRGNPVGPVRLGTVTVRLAVPVDRSLFAMHVQFPQALAWRSMTTLPVGSIRAVQPCGMTTVVSGYSRIAGPDTVKPTPSSAPS